MRFVSVSFFVPPCFGFIWFQRSFGYKCFLISSVFVHVCHPLSHVCHFPKRRCAPTGESDRNCASLTRAALMLVFIWRAPFVDTRDTPLARRTMCRISNRKIRTSALSGIGL